MLLNYIDNYKSIIEIINKHKRVNNRDIRLIVVSKTQDYKKIIELEKLGQRDFGENYLDEGQRKNYTNRQSKYYLALHWVNSIK
jgi:uncharacterized pyridoxal phosphate-containing UPF0001 family protein